MPAIQRAGLKLGVDPLGGSGIAYWQRVAEHYKLDLTLVNDSIDQTFRFMHWTTTASSAWTVRPSRRWPACWRCATNSIWRLPTIRITTAMASSRRRA